MVCFTDLLNYLPGNHNGNNGNNGSNNPNVTRDIDRMKESNHLIYIQCTLVVSRSTRNDSVAHSIPKEI